MDLELPQTLGYKAAGVVGELGEDGRLRGKLVLTVD